MSNKVIWFSIGVLVTGLGVFIWMYSVIKEAERKKKRMVILKRARSV